MSIPSETKVYVLANPPTGAIKPDTFKLETRSLPKESELKDGELLFKTVALSNDPAQRTWMTKDVDAVSSHFFAPYPCETSAHDSDDFMPHLSDRETLSRLELCLRLSLERVTSSRSETESTLNPLGLNTSS